MADFASERETMVERQLRRRGIRGPRILDAFRSVAREAFVEAGLAHLAYGDYPLPIEAGQTISQPYIVGLMIQAAAIEPGDRVLEVGSGSGYAAAVMSRIAEQVIAIERHDRLVELSRERLRRLGFGNVLVVQGDGSKGWLDDAPYDAILAAASGSHLPQPLVDQLRAGGRLVLPVGRPGWSQKLWKVVKREDGSLQQSDLGAVRFVPLIGEEGWKNA